MKANDVLLPVTTSLSPFYTMRGDSRIDRVKADLRNIGQGVSTYASRYGDWPATLFALTLMTPDGKSALLPPRAIIDPWGREYNYDPMTLHPKTGRPLICTEGPNPGQTGSKISNWELD